MAGSGRGAAPTEDEAIARLRQVQSLSPEAFDTALRTQLGTPMAGVFAALVRSLHPGDDDEAIARKLHLMMLAWLMAHDVGGDLGASTGGTP